MTEVALFTGLKDVLHQLRGVTVTDHVHGKVDAGATPRLIRHHHQ
jgi:hypothetical protein